MAKFEYDALGHRIYRYDAIADEDTFYYYNAAWQVLSEYDDSTHKMSYIYGNYIDEVLVRFVGSACKYFVHDHLYSPVALAASDGSLLERYEYDAYGNCHILDPSSYAPKNSSIYNDTILFTGRRLDILDNGSLKLQYNRNRYYDQYTGRWLTHAPKMCRTPSRKEKNESIVKIGKIDMVTVPLFLSTHTLRFRQILTIFALLLGAVGQALAADDAVRIIQLEATSTGRVFEGVGAVSAGASTRLLPDYPEPQRSQILDFLFKPKFGAGFQHLKVEIGSGENSTCGSEPSHAVTRTELADPKPRGYEFWLMAEARKRNPQIILDCLPWGYPHWVGDRFSPASADWFAAFLEAARKNYGLELDWVSAAQNEMGTDLNWIRKSLRPKLDARGFSKVKLQAPDNNGDHWQIFNTLEQDSELDRLIGAVGYHYLDGRDPWEIDQQGGPAATEKAKRSGKPLWASEEWSQSGGEWGDKGALYLARLMNKLYTRDRVTKYEIWCPIDSIYDQIIWADTGAMQADTPWCGHYTVWPAVWAIAHTTQFAEPGWVYVDGACGQMDTDTWRGSHVALRNPETGDWSVVIVTGEKRTIRLTVLPGLKNGPVHVWKSAASAQFIEQPSLSLSNNSVELELEPDAIYTITSTTGQQRGSHGTPPPRKPFPFPFEENFETYHVGDTPRYFSDQKGTFEVCRSPKGGLCLAQIVPAEGILWFAKLLKPHTLFGDTNWRDCVIEADVLLAGGDVEIGGRYADRDKLGYRWILTRDGRWQLDWQSTSLASGRIKEFKPADWHHLRLELNGDRISGAVDGKPLAAVTDASRASGMAFLSSTYDHNLFDNVRIGPLPTADQAVPDGRTIAQN